MNKKILNLIVLVLGCTHFYSCASSPKIRPTAAAQAPAILEPRKNIVHTVGPGETFWRIAKMYDVPIATIMSVNNITNPQNLKMGQQLSIPQAAELKTVVPLFPSKKWKYIIIHHSATEDGNALKFHMSHRAKGWDSVGYNFIIDNGTGNRKDGQIEATPRWIKQIDGAHCKAADMNSKGIGICLVGNFNNEQVSEKQLESLVYLVQLLKDTYHIPDSHIIGHGEVPGASTACPGIISPGKAFWKSYTKATTSISIRTFLGSRATSTVERAGAVKGSKNSEYTMFIPWKSVIFCKYTVDLMTF